MEQLQDKLSEKTYNELELFLINTNLDSSQKDKLIKIISKIFSDGEFSGHHKSCNLNGKISAQKIM